MMAAQATEEEIPYILLPSSRVARMWNLLYFLVVLYTAFSVPFYPAFSTESGVSVASTDQIPASQLLISSPISGGSLFAADVVMYAFFVADIFLRMNNFAIEHEGKLLKQPLEFSAVYKKTYFYSDCLSVVPLSLILWAIRLSNPDSPIDSRAISYTRVFYLLRVRNVQWLWKQILSTLEHLIDRRISDDISRLVQTFFMVCYYAHVAACIFCIIGFSEQLNCDPAFAGYPNCSWLSNNGYVSTSYLEMTAFDIYIYAYLWSLYSTATVGYGNIIPLTNLERIYAVLVMMIGAILCDAVVVAVLSQIINETDDQSGLVRRFLLALQRFRKTHFRLKESSQVQNIDKEISSYFSYRAQSIGNGNDFEDFNLLSDPLKRAFFCKISKNSFAALATFSLKNLGILKTEKHPVISKVLLCL
jgi:hypothetical protein